MTNRVGQQLGNYRLLHLIGRGSFAEVYLGEHLHLNSQAAIKVIYTHLTTLDIEQFRTEARTVAGLVHPHIVRILDFDVEDGIPFLVMEYATNGPLRQRHSKGTLVPLATIVPYVKQVADALQYIHEHGQIHRNVKPESMVLGRNNEILLVEFGIPTIVQSSHSHLHQGISGTFAYMAPEQFQGHPGPASDQYALAVVVYEWLSGECPFRGESIAELASQHLSVPPPSLCARVPTIPPAVEQVVFQALAKDPQQRYVNVKAFAMALEEAARTESSEHPAEAGQRNSPMGKFPTGTVTLLFTDIEESTNLLLQLGDRYASVLLECRQLLRAVFREWSGHEVDTQGDAFFVAFARATDAVLAAVDAQRALSSHAFPEGVAVRVRIGLHTGEPALTSEGYVGLDVHRAARIMSAGHGGQVLLSQTTCNLVEQDLPDDVSLRDLGNHRLKDLGRPNRLFQLVISDLPADFPPPRTLDFFPNNLPVQPTPFIGREKELMVVRDLLLREDVRLVTLTGPGGTGKTRLGLQEAAELSDLFASGTFFVNLAPINDSALVVSIIAETLGVREKAGQSLLEHLKGELRQKQMLLILDNFEQVVNAAEQVEDLLAACPQLKMMVTSREVLHVRTEHEFVVPPLELPDPKRLPDLATLSQYAAIAFFIQRTQAVKPDFQMTNANARAIAEICTRLDGLPLAIELAAARIKLLPPQALLARMDQRLQVLTSTLRGVPTRQQTLRNTIEWSYKLLDEQEQRLFRRLAVFVGGCMLEAVEAICIALDGEADHVLNTVASLIDKSLLQQAEQEGEEPRFVMLETIREYGVEQLAVSGEQERIRRAHAASYMAWAQEMMPNYLEIAQAVWLKRFDREQENLRAALSWLIEHEETDSVLVLCGACWQFWYLRGYWSEARRWLEGALGLPGTGGSIAARAAVLFGAGRHAHAQRDLVAAHARLEESAILYRKLGDKRGQALALSSLGSTMYLQNDPVAARALHEESVLLARESGDRSTLANALHNLGRFTRDQDDPGRTFHLLEEGMALFRELGEKRGLSRTLNALVQTSLIEGNVTQAAAFAQESLAVARELDNKPDIAKALYYSAHVASFQDDPMQTAALLEECLDLDRELGDKGHLASTLLFLGTLALSQSDTVRAAKHAQESLALFRQLRSTDGISLVFCLLGDIRRMQGDLLLATACYNEGLSLAREAGYKYGIGWNLIGLAKVAAAEGQAERAARLFGAVEPWFNPNMDVSPTQSVDYQRTVESVRAQLGEKVFAAAWAEGRTMTPEQALAAKGQVTIPIPPPAEPSSAPPTKSPTTFPDGLTAREVEVLRLVAQGLTNEQVAEQLIISPRTVNTHLTSIYGKIGVSSRSGATRYAIEHKFV